ncbi:MAG TPA: hypothetical protein VH561_14875 [Micromonosporaceae bacterium]|jgi:hypothetical protein
MGEQRRQILEMLAEGKISADEAERLIGALEGEGGVATASEPRKSGPKYLRVLVDDQSNGEPTQVNVRVPIRLLRAGVRLAGLIPQQALEKANDEIRRSGVPIDLTRLKPEDIDELVDSLEELTVDVNEANTKVRVFAE